MESEVGSVECEGRWARLGAAALVAGSEGQGEKEEGEESWEDHSLAPLPAPLPESLTASLGASLDAVESEAGSSERGGRQVWDDFPPAQLEAAELEVGSVECQGGWARDDCPSSQKELGLLLVLVRGVQLQGW